MILVVEVADRPPSSREDDVVEIARRRPAECSPEEIESFARLLRRTFGAAPGDRARRIGRARCLVFLREGEGLVGIAGLKVPTASHRRGVFVKAGVPLSGPAPPYELGWVVVDERQRGRRHSRLLVESALQAAGEAEVFATSHTENLAMHATLRRCGFTAVGDPYFSRRHERRLVLFVRARAASPTGRADTGSGRVGGRSRGRGSFAPGSTPRGPE